MSAAGRAVTLATRELLKKIDAHPTRRVVDDAALVDSASRLLHVAIAIRADGVITSAEFPALLIQVEQTKRDLDGWLEEQRRFLIEELP